MQEKYVKKFDEWNQRKKILNDRIIPDDFFVLEREIWWVSWGVNIGIEIDGKHDPFERPALVLKLCGYDGCLVLPISTKSKVGKGFYPLVYRNEKMTISLLQIRFMSINRLLRLVRRMEEKEFLKIKKKFLRLVYKNETPYF